MSIKKGSKGINIVESIVIDHLGEWQKLDHENDFGIDGLIFIRKKKVQTGTVIYTQVKYGTSYFNNAQNNPNFIRIKLGKKYIQKHREYWENIQEPVILVYIDNDKRAWWASLKSSLTYSDPNKDIVLIPKSQRFYSHSKSDLMRLSGAYFKHKKIRLLVDREDVGYVRLSESIKFYAREYYKKWQNEKTINPILGEITVNRIGWKHISRPGRKFERIINSWLLLGVAKRIIEKISYYYRLGSATIENVNRYYDHDKNELFYGKYKLIKDYIGLRATIEFPHRDSSLVQVVIKRIRIIDSNGKIVMKMSWFFSVYEKRISVD